jgi:hypothetical protein
VFVLTPAIVDRHLALKGGTAGNLKTIKNQLHLILQQQFIGGEKQ